MGEPLKVALCYSGLMRTWDQCRENHFENIFKRNDCTAYFHTDRHPWPEGKWDFKFHWVPLPEKMFYDDVFAPHPYDSNRSPEGNIRQSKRQWHGNLVAFSIIPSHYDVYVRIRPDHKFSGPITFQKPEPNTIYIPQGNDFRGINDQFAYGDWTTMRDYFMVYENSHHLWQRGTMHNSEVMQLANLVDKGINIIRFDDPQHEIIR